MSASTEKKLRQAAREAGTDKKAIAAAEEAEKKAKSKKRWTWTMIGVVVFIALVLILNSTALYTKTVAATVGGESISPARMNYSYATQYLNFTQSYGSYASLFGLDTSAGINGLKGQACPMDDSVADWKEYFMNSAVSALQQNIALKKYAEENGIELSEEDLAALEENYASIEEAAASYGYASGDKLIAANYGRGNDLSTARQYDLISALASKVYSQRSEEIDAEVTDAEVAEAYPTVAVRHILVKAVAEEDGTYTDEAKEAAKAKAEEIYEQWKSGDADEDSFAALAEEFSEDEGSNTNGGLYNSVMEGQMVTEFNDFCFDESRKPGDTGIVYGESGAYAGYHVMYFVGEGDPADNATGRSYVVSERLSAWVEELAETQEVTDGPFKFLVGKF